jgi:hypothetical protein
VAVGDSVSSDGLFRVYEDVWEFNQLLKPDDWLPGFIWGFDGFTRAGSGEDLFWRKNSLDLPAVYLAIGSQANIANRYEMMAYAAEAESRALGRVTGNFANSFAATVDLQAIWERDLAPDSSGLLFKGLIWHSGEFQFSNADQGRFWRQLLNQFGIANLR